MTTTNQKLCLRWDSFKANITSQFETLRDDEDFTDVTIACGGQQLQAHKLILSACSPFFKELLKSNPCRHPIIFMRDVEAQHVVSLMEFMYAGEVKVTEAQLPMFLKTAEALKVRGLAIIDAENTVPLDKDPLALSNSEHRLIKPKVSCSSIVTSSQDVRLLRPDTPPPSKRCKTEVTGDPSNTNQLLPNLNRLDIVPKHERSDYFSDEDVREDGSSNFNSVGDVSELIGGMEIIPQSPYLNNREGTSDAFQGTDDRKLHSLDPRPCQECGRIYSNLSNLRQHLKLVHYPTHVVCSICRKSFKTNLYLKRHIASSHGSFRNSVVNCNPTNYGDDYEAANLNYSMLYN